MWDAVINKHKLKNYKHYITFIDGVGDCEHHMLRTARHRNSSEALVHALQFEAAEAASHYINGLRHYNIVKRSQYYIAVTMSGEKLCCRTHNSKAVSYTHLDVYKRQGRTR